MSEKMAHLRVWRHESRSSVVPTAMTKLRGYHVPCAACASRAIYMRWVTSLYSLYTTLHTPTPPDRDSPLDLPWWNCCFDCIFPVAVMIHPQKNLQDRRQSERYPPVQYLVIGIRPCS